VTERFIMRHYGSCGHVVDTESKKDFDEFARLRQTTDLMTGQIVEYQNEVTTDGDAKVVHVHPFRHCPCKNCVETDLADEEARYEKRAASLPKVRARDEQKTRLEVKRILRERNLQSFWISNKDLYVAFERLPKETAERFLAVGATVDS